MSATADQTLADDNGQVAEDRTPSPGLDRRASIVLSRAGPRRRPRRSRTQGLLPREACSPSVKEAVLDTCRNNHGLPCRERSMLLAHPNLGMAIEHGDLHHVQMSGRTQPGSHHCSKMHSCTEPFRAETRMR